MTFPHTLPDPEIQPEFYADIPVKRLVAWVADMIVIIVICVLIVPLTAFTGIFFFPFLVLVVGFAYRVVTLANGSATWGMRLVAIEMRATDGTRFDLSKALLHTLGYSISFTLPILQFISIVLMLTSARAQGLTDHMMGTVAINRAARY
ncbi:RDD family protein [Salinihabitans flavidus]|uniref:RDD family protein n=1 Tax=Salinihabitans flavidus TaxID=569882 RepID=A0A1H8N5C8_9RHOB|nr:RDD family protein [Salinihabitans flavidus]SEO24780.1 RDD family protein [Salinihabitans flavidus]